MWNGVKCNFSSPHHHVRKIVRKLSIRRFLIWNFTRIGPKTKKLWLSIVPARRRYEQPGLGPPQKGVNCNFSWPEFDKPYSVRKFSISEAKKWSFSRIAQKIKKYSSFKFLAENLEKFRSTEPDGAALVGSTNFLCRSSLGCTSKESCQLPDLKYAIFSRTGCKTKILPRSKLFLSMVFKHGLLEGSTSEQMWNTAFPRGWDAR